MARTKIDFGIDLGTTNSAIACMKEGSVEIIKGTKHQKDTTPSCVYFGKKKNFTGDDAIQKHHRDLFDAWSKIREPGDHEHASNSFVEFKRTMGTDISYFSSNKNRSYTPEELSAELLKKLKSYVIEEDVRAAVITIPMRFEQHQMDATQRAAELAGFKYFELLQEPIAASLAYGIDKKVKDGNWLVFDFGGGTFDVALMEANEGIIKPVDTAGDTQLGGKDIDNIIVDKIIIPHLKEKYSIDSYLEDEKALFHLRGALKYIAEEAKIMMSKKNKFTVVSEEPLGIDEEGEEIEIDMELSIEDFEEAVTPVFQRAIDVSLELMEKYNMKGAELTAVIMVGGPTFSQTLRAMAREQISPNVDTSIDPMTCVARGAAFLAATKDIPLQLQGERDRTKIQLSLKYPATTVESDVNLGIRIDRSNMEGNAPDKLFAEIVRADHQWSSGRMEIEKDADIVTIPLQPDVPNSFTITMYDEKGASYPCEPFSFVIIQGVVPSKQIISQSICIEAFDVASEKPLLREIRGLEKNQPLPVKAKFTGKTQQDIRPGKKEDIIRIPLYNGDNKTRNVYNEYAGTVVISGDQLSDFLPEGSEVEVTLYVDESHGITLTAYFLYLDHTVEEKLESHTQKEFPPEIILEGIEQAQQELSSLDDDSSDTTWKEAEKLQAELQQVEDELQRRGGDRDAKIGIMGRLRKIMRSLDKLENENAWPALEEKLQDALERVEITNEKYGNEETEKIIEGFQRHAQGIIDKEDSKLAGELIEKINSLGFALVSEQIGLWISYLKDYDEEFETYEWKDKREARRLIEEGKRIANSNPTIEQLRPIVWQIIRLLPEPERPALTEKDRELLGTE